jgi:hypothetical protein
VTQLATPHLLDEPRPAAVWPPPDSPAAKTLGKGGAAMPHGLMRHSSVQITMDYYAGVDDALQDAILNLK